MSILLYAAGAIVIAIGAAMIGFGIPINEFSFGNTLIIAGTVAIAGGLIMLALGVVVRELRNIADAYSRASARPGRPAEADGMFPARAPQPAAARVPFPPKPKGPARTDAVTREPRDEPLDEPRADLASPPFAIPASRMAPKATAMMAPVAPPAAAPKAAPAPAPVAAHTQPRPEEEVFGAPALPNPDDTPDLGHEDEASALTARAGGTNEFEPLLPPLYLGRDAASEPSGLSEPEFPPLRRPEPPSRPSPPPAVEKPERSNYFDSMWPADPHPLAREAFDEKPESAADVALHDEAEPAEAEPGHAAADVPVEPPPSVPILKSGVVDGMGYTLYVDGSIEAELPQGTLRFASINELRAHLERTA